MAQVYLQTSLLGFVKLSAIEFPELNRIYIITGGPLIIFDLSKITKLDDTNSITLWLTPSSLKCNIKIKDEETFEATLAQHIFTTSTGRDISGYIVNKLQ